MPLISSSSLRLVSSRLSVGGRRRQWQSNCGPLPITRSYGIHPPCPSLCVSPLPPPPPHTHVLPLSHSLCIPRPPTFPLLPLLLGKLRPKRLQPHLQRFPLPPLGKDGRPLCQQLLHLSPRRSGSGGLQVQSLLLTENPGWQTGGTVMAWSVEPIWTLSLHIALRLSL